MVPLSGLGCTSNAEHRSLTQKLFFYKKLTPSTAHDLHAMIRGAKRRSNFVREALRNRGEK